MKKIYKCFILVAVLCCIIISTSFAGCSLFSSGNSSNLFEYGLKVGDTYYIKNIKSKDITEVEIPQSYDNKKITGIDYNAFENCTSLKKVIIPEGITEIGKYAFKNCTSLETISIPKSIKEIGVGAFDNCNSLKYNLYQNGHYLGNDDDNYLVLFNGIDSSAKSFHVHDACQIIYSKALYSFSNMKSVEMPYSITDIGSRAFGLCSSLESFLVPNYIKNFSLEWFENCNSLKTITISANVETVALPSYSFTCKNLSEFTVYSTNSKFTAKDGVLYSKDLKTLLSYPVGKINTSFEIPTYVESLSTYAFNGCNNLKSITMYPTVETLRSSAVINCNNLHTLYFKGTTTEWLKLDNANLGWDNGFAINKVYCSNGSFDRGKA